MDNSFKTRVLSVLLLICLLALASVVRSPARSRHRTIIVPDNYITIQEAINAALDGDTIYVRSGNYHEHVVVDRLVSIIGQSPETTTVQWDGVGSVIQVASNGVTITGFTIENKLKFGHDGVGLVGITDCTIFGNNIANNWFGVCLLFCSNVNITGNYMTNNAWGIGGNGCSNIIVAANNVTDNYSGIGLDQSSSVQIVGNNISRNLEIGIACDFPYDNNNIESNTIRMNHYGIYIGSSETDVSEVGNNITGNTIAENYYGIYLWRQQNITQNIVAYNNITNNANGVMFYQSSRNRVFHNNFVNNTLHVHNQDSQNHWDNGYPEGGNYWSTHPTIDILKGPQQNLPGSDGITDTPYVVGGSSQDRYPLLNSYGYPPQRVYTLTITTTSGGSSDPAPEPYTYIEGQTVPVLAIPDTSWILDNWELDGVNIGKSNPTNVTMNSNHTLHVSFSYTVTVKAYCNTEGRDVNVTIRMDDSPTVYTTPTTFTRLTGIHAFEVPAYDENGHLLKGWNSGQTSPNITLSSGGTYTAYYDVRYTLTITNTDGGSTTPEASEYFFWSETAVSITAMSDPAYYLDYWQLNGVNIGAPNPLTIIMNANYTLHATFTLLSEGHDVAIKYVTSKDVVGEGCSAGIKVTAMNVGSFTEIFNVTAYVNMTSIAWRTVTLESGAPTAITFLFNTTGFAKGYYILSSLAWPVLEETQTEDNNYTDGLITVSIVGDITGPDLLPDGACDMRDVSLVARHFGQGTPPAPANCDLTGPTTGVPDGTIDMRDVGLVARHFGETDR